MAATMIQKILGQHSGQTVLPGQIIDVVIDVRVARDFGGANVVKNIRDNRLGIHDPSRTFFTFDCNPGGSDQKYATNQQICRLFAREHGLSIYDIDRGIGTHVAIDEGMAVPGCTLVSTDSHANILGAIGAFGQGMGDVDIAHAFAHGKIWFKVPPTVKITLTGIPSPLATPKDLVLAVLNEMGANGLLGYAAEFYGNVIDGMNLSGRITMASMATEMAGIIALFPPNRDVIDHCRQSSRLEFEPVYSDPDARYEKQIEIQVDGLTPQISRPGHPEDVVPVETLAGTKLDSAFVGSCTNGRFEDMMAVAEILRGRKVAPGMVMKIVPSTDRVWNRCLKEGVLDIFKEAGALVGNAGCAGCAAGQIGQNGPGEVTLSTGNRNFSGKQGKGDVYLASPAVVAASAVAGVISLPDSIPDTPVLFHPGRPTGAEQPSVTASPGEPRPLVVRGRVWVVRHDNIDTDMIFHNRHLTITDPSEMGQHTFGNLKGWESFSRQVRPGDIVVTGKNFGAGSSRQQAVDCFESLGVSLLVAESFGAIYERNAINKGFPILTARLMDENLKDGDEIEVNLESGEIKLPDGRMHPGDPFSEVQLDIYKKGGLLNPT